MTSEYCIRELASVTTHESCTEFVARMSASDMREKHPRGRFARPGYVLAYASRA